jgi:hypothetical protein
MTPEQFVYWLAGYLQDKEHEIDSAVLKEALTKIKVERHDGSFMACFRGDSP